MTRRIGFGSGLPNGIPDFRPINPWGRAMPKPARPYRDKPLHHALYQVFVDTRKGTIPVGPRWSEELAGAFAETINKAVALGAEKEWGRAHVRLVKAAEVRDTRTIREILLGN